MKTLIKPSGKSANALLFDDSVWSRRERYVSRGVFHYNQIILDRAKGALCWDNKGKRYIDFAGGIGALNVGHCHPRVIKAIEDQARRLIHACAHVAPYEGYVEVCRKLCESAQGSFAKKAALFNSGAEAVENAVKFARRATGRPAVIAFDLSFHGRTMMAMTLTGKDKPYRNGFGPYAPEVYHSPYPYAFRLPAGIPAGRAGAYALERLAELFEAQVDPSRIAAVIIEPVLGEGGFVPAPFEFLKELQALCRRHGIVFIVDEIQTGFGRTGRMFAGEHAGLEPDLMTVAKSLAAGLPLSAVVGRAEIMDAVDPGGIGGTYGGNPVACAASLAVFEIFKEERLAERGADIGRRIERRFKDFERRFSIVGEARGLGAMRALELVAGRKTKAPLDEMKMKAILKSCADRGLLILKAGLHNNVIRTLVPLVAENREIDEGLDILESVLEVSQGGAK